MERDFGGGAPTASGNEPPAVPLVQGFTIAVGGPIPNIDYFKPENTPNNRQWQAMVAQIRESGDRTDKTTPRGRNHPCQTDDLRCDHQGEAGKYVNTQVQVGGREKNYQRGKYKNHDECTTVSHVMIAAAAYGKGLVKECLAQAHDHSFRTRRTVTVDVAASTAPVAQAVQAGPMNFVCANCGARTVALDAVSLGLRVGGYPPRCRCGGPFVRS